MLFTNKLLARRSEKHNIVTYTKHVHDVNHTTYSNIAVMYHRGRDAEILGGGGGGGGGGSCLLFRYHDQRVRRCTLPAYYNIILSSKSAGVHYFLPTQDIQERVLQ